LLEDDCLKERKHLLSTGKSSNSSSSSNAAGLTSFVDSALLSAGLALFAAAFEDGAADMAMNGLFKMRLYIVSVGIEVQFSNGLSQESYSRVRWGLWDLLLLGAAAA
jgi:hypothetical protein